MDFPTRQPSPDGGVLLDENRVVIPRPGHAAFDDRTAGRRAEESTFGLLEAGRGSPRSRRGGKSA
jgi:hypothetical protein